MKNNPPDIDELSRRLALLDERRRRLLALRLHASSLSRSRHDAAGDFPLTSTQVGIWLYEELVPGTSVYNNPAGLRIRGELDVDALRDVIHLLEWRHEAMRTVFGETDDGDLCQKISSRSRLPFEVVDMRGRTDAEAAAEDLATRAAIDPFDVVDGPLWRAVLFRLADDDNILVLTLHHLISDGWTLGLLLRDLIAGYGAPASLAFETDEGTPDYRGAVLRRLASEENARKEQLAYWRDTVSDPAPAPIAFDTRPTDAPGHAGGELHFEVPADVARQLRGLAARERTTVFATLVAAFAAVLGRRAERDTMYISTPVATREDPQTAEVVGCFLNIVLLRVDLEGDPSPRVLLRRVAQTIRSAIAHANVPFADVVRLAAGDRTSIRATPMSNVMVSENNAPIGPWKLGDLTVDRYPIPLQNIRHDLSISVSMSPQGISGKVEYARSIGADVPGAVSAEVTRFLTHMARDPDSTSGWCGRSPSTDDPPSPKTGAFDE